MLSLRMDSKFVDAIRKDVDESVRETMKESSQEIGNQWVKKKSVENTFQTSTDNTSAEISVNIKDSKFDKGTNLKRGSNGSWFIESPMRNSPKKVTAPRRSMGWGRSVPTPAPSQKNTQNNDPITNPYFSSSESRDHEEFIADTFMSVFNR